MKMNPNEFKIECKKCGSWIIEKAGDAGNMFIEQEDKYGGKKVVYAESIGWRCRCGAIDRKPRVFNHIREPGHENME